MAAAPHVIERLPGIRLSAQEPGDPLQMLLLCGARLQEEAALEQALQHASAGHRRLCAGAGGGEPGWRVSELAPTPHLSAKEATTDSQTLTRFVRLIG